VGLLVRALEQPTFRNFILVAFDNTVEFLSKRASFELLHAHWRHLLRCRYGTCENPDERDEPAKQGRN
jgi:hypothetical protein